MEYLQIEKNASPYTLRFYEDDLDSFFSFLKEENLHDLRDINQHDIRIFLTNLYNKKMSRKTVSRMLSCLRSFYRFLEREAIVPDNPFIHVSLPKEEKRIPSFFV